MDNTFNNIYLSEQKRIVGQMKTDASGITWKSEEQSIKYEPKMLKNAYWCKVSANFQLRFELSGGNSCKFDGFRRTDYDTLKPYLSEVFGIEIQDDALSCSGANWGNNEFEGPEGNESMVMKDVEGKRVFEIGLSELSQCALPNKMEVEFQFVEEDTSKVTEESLVSIKFYVPSNADKQGETTAATRFQQDVLNHAGLSNNTGNMITELDSRIGSFVTPRGRYNMEFYDNYMRMSGKTYTYKILYKTISSIYMFDLPDATHRALVFSLSSPLRQSQQTYPHLVLYAPTDRTSITINLSEEVMATRYGGMLKDVMKDEGYRLVSKLFKFIGGVKLLAPKDFKTSRGDSFVRCVYKSDGGLMYFMEKSLFFIHKPTLQIGYEDIAVAEYRRYEPNAHSSNRTFDIVFRLKGQGNNGVTFHNFEYDDFSAIHAKLHSKDIIERGLKQASQQFLESDSEDEEFDNNSIAGQMSEDGDFNGENGDKDSSDTDEMMKELEPESDDMLSDEEKGKKPKSKEDKDVMVMEEEDVSSDDMGVEEDAVPSKKQKVE